MADKQGVEPTKPLEILIHNVSHRDLVRHPPTHAMACCMSARRPLTALTLILAGVRHMPSGRPRRRHCCCFSTGHGRWASRRKPRAGKASLLRLPVAQQCSARDAGEPARRARASRGPLRRRGPEHLRHKSRGSSRCGAHTGWTQAAGGVAAVYASAQRPSRAARARRSAPPGATRPSVRHRGGRSGGDGGGASALRSLFPAAGRASAQVG